MSKYTSPKFSHSSNVTTEHLQNKYTYLDALYIHTYILYCSPLFLTASSAHRRYDKVKNACALCDLAVSDVCLAHYMILVMLLFRGL